MSPPAATCSAACSVKPPANTASRRKAARSSAVEQVVAPVQGGAQGLVARGADRAPPTSTAKMSSSRSASWAGERIRIRAAASSIASGRPSSRRQMVSTAAAFSSVSRNDGRTSCARCSNSLTASDPASSEGGRRGIALGQRQRRNRPAELTLHAEGLAAGGQQDQRRARRQQIFRQAGRGLREVLAVIQHQQRRMVGNVLGYGLDRVLPGGIGHAELGGDRLADDARVFDLGQRHPGRPAGKGGVRRSRGGQRQPRLSGARRARSG